MPRMKILSTVEQEAFDLPPEFTGVQRKQYFDIPLVLQRVASNLRTPTHHLGFLLSCGYFKDAKRFFTARRHVNLLGEYDFSDEKLEDTVGIRSPKLAA